MYTGCEDKNNRCSGCFYLKQRSFPDAGAVRHSRRSGADFCKKNQANLVAPSKKFYFLLAFKITFVYNSSYKQNYELNYEVMNKKVYVWCYCLIALVVILIISSALVPIVRGPMNPKIIGSGFVYHDDKVGTYVEVDSQRYVISECISVIFPSFPVKYNTDTPDWKVATVFTSDKIDGYAATIGIEEDEKIIERAYQSPFLECFSYNRPYYLLALFWIPFSIILIGIFFTEK